MLRILFFRKKVPVAFSIFKSGWNREKLYRLVGDRARERQQQAADREEEEAFFLAVGPP